LLETLLFEGQRRNLIDVNKEQVREKRAAGRGGGGTMKGMKKDKRVIAGYGY
jgi:hypothetical protein